VTRFLFVCLALILCCATPVAAETQRDVLQQLISSLGWDQGLPENPSDADYLRIMNGMRRLHFEVEEIMAPDSQVSLKNLKNYGPFSGENWVSGTSAPTNLELTFLLPISGRYRIFATLRQPAFAFEIGGKILTADGGMHFEKVELGSVALSAGKQVVSISLPPNGGLDDLELVAPNLPPVAPLGGWQLDREMTADELGTVAVKLLGVENLLPPSGQTRLIEAEKLAGIDPSMRTESVLLGPPSGKAWVQAGAESTTLTTPLFLDQGGAIRFDLRGLGQSPVKIAVDGEEAGTVSFPGYLQDSQGPTRFLSAGEHVIELTLPPRGGLDYLALVFLSRDPADYRRLSGINDFELRSARLGTLFSLFAALLPDR